ncbi:hypothetical protein Q8F55_005984 [Vanrija albida]|uniref:Uncharacterized protein n=1 Tax=Vanrija albida TaxID=181172 RepID=A0ABR3Q319_9TREE
MSLHVDGQDAPFRNHWTVGPGSVHTHHFQYVAYRRPDGATWFGAEVDDFESHYDRKGGWVWSFMTVRGVQEERRDAEVKAVGWDEYRRLWRDEEDVYWPAFEKELARLKGAPGHRLDPAPLLRALAHLAAHRHVRAAEGDSHALLKRSDALW